MQSFRRGSTACQRTPGVGERPHQDQGQSFNPSCHGALFSQDISQSVDGERFGYGASVGQLLRQVVETVRDRGIFHDITFVQDIRPSGRHVDLEQIRICRAGFGVERHLIQQGGLLLSGQGETRRGVDVG